MIDDPAAAEMPVGIRVTQSLAIFGRHTMIIHTELIFTFQRRVALAVAAALFLACMAWALAVQMGARSYIDKAGLDS